jgi:hypothetical protein
VEDARLGPGPAAAGGFLLHLGQIQ